MTRLLLLIVLALLTWLYFPETRSILMDVAEPVALPIQRWSTQEEMQRVGRHVLDHERLTGSLPTVSGWLDWIDYRYPSDDIATDPWGTFYQLVVWPDSVGIVSLGPDRTRLTEDDFVVVTERE